ncbi:MAG TPA: hypothetical protein VEV81_15645, partial [Pyrinomonadaceae bacterium]|nr:hypothetical protein [Pyrinomonadaceae bacterium]
SFLSGIGRWMTDHLRVVQAIIEIQRAIKTRLAAAREQKQATTTGGGAGNEAAAADEIGIDNLIYREPEEEVWKDAWRVTEGLILEMRNEVRSRGAKFLLVTLSNGIQVHPDPNARQAFMQRTGATDLFYPDLRLRSLCEREGIPVITLAPLLQEYAERNKVFLHGFGKEVGNGHWNIEGHRVAGEMIADKLCEGMAK